jgi:F-type H+-transporting ATPase subunit a
MMFIVIAVILYLMLSAAKHYKNKPGTAPKGIASFVEPIIVFVRDEIALPNIGHKKYLKFTPYLLTLFFFIWIGNLMGLFPEAANFTGNIALTFTLAIFTFIITNINGNKDYWKHVFATPGVPVPLLLIIVPVEIIGLFTKPFALMVRLFVAITAGHIVILSFIALIFVFESFAVGLASTVMVVFINFIELLVATIQAYVFTLFSAMYIGMAVADHDHH